MPAKRKPQKQQPVDKPFLLWRKSETEHCQKLSTLLMPLEFLGGGTSFI